MGVEENLWSVKLPSGDIRSGTLEQLDEAFQAGLIGDGALVRAAGSDDWVKLSDLLSGTEGASAPPRAPEPATPAAVEPASSTPTLDETTKPTHSAPPVSAATTTSAATATGPIPALTTAPSVAPVPVPHAVAPPIAAAPAVVPSQPVPVTRPEADADVWQLKLPSGDVRSGTRRQLEEALAAGHIDSNALVIPFGAREWVKLSNTSLGGVATVSTQTAKVVSPHPVAPSSPAPPGGSSPPQGAEGVPWQVKLPSGEVRTGMRGQLEEAFQAGHIDGAAQVLAAGARDWVPLSTLFTRAPGTEAPGTRPPPSSRVPAKGFQPAFARPPSTAPSPQAPAPSPAPLSQPPRQQETVEHRDLWQVNLTRKQLGDALRMGLLTESTLVLAAGASEAVKLGSVLRGGPQTNAPGAIARPRTSPPAVSVKAPEVAPQVRDVAPQVRGSEQATSDSKEIWQLKLPGGEVRAGSRQQLEEALQAGHLDANSLVLPAGKTEWTKLSLALGQSPAPTPMVPSVAASPAKAPSVVPNAVSVPAVARSAPPEGAPWQARLPSGELRSGSRDQLAEALKLGHLPGDTPVLPPGATEWVTLGSLAADSSQSRPAAVGIATLPETRRATSTAEWPPVASEAKSAAHASPPDAAADAGTTGPDYEALREAQAFAGDRDVVNGQARTELPGDEPGGDEEPASSESPRG